MRFEVRERYGLVLAGALIALFVTIALPDGKASGVIVLVLQGLLLVLTLIAAPPRTGGRTASAATVIAVLVAFAGALGGVPTWLVFAASATFLVGAIATLARGALLLLENGGVTAPVVAAALAIYVLVGLLFATLIGAIADTTLQPYFQQGTDGSPGSRVYYSFTALTTTGFGDFTPAFPLGRALAVGEMLIGQIYLVTIVALLIGNLRRRPESSESAD